MPWHLHGTLSTGRWLFDLGAVGIGSAMLPWLNVGVEIGGQG